MNEKDVKSGVSEGNFYNIFQILYFSITKVREKHGTYAKRIISLNGELTCFYKDLSCLLIKAHSHVREH